MFKRDATGGAAPFAEKETIIAQGVKVEGDFMSQGQVIIDGEVAGSVHTGQSLRIGPTAIIRADVSAKEASVAGVIEGNISVETTLELLESSRVNGDIEAQILTVAPGAKINGRVTMLAEGEREETEEIIEPKKRGRNKQEEFAEGEE